MKTKELKYLLDIQYFAEGGEGGSEGSEEVESTDNEDLETGTQEQEDEQKETDDEKKFTQKDLNEIGSKEKKKGKRAILSALGFKTEDEAKQFISKYRQSEQRDEGSKASEAEVKLAEAEKKAAEAESKLILLSAGVPKSNWDDVLAIAVKKVDDENDLEDVIDAMKKDPKYNSLLGIERQEEQGTGSGGSGKKAKGTTGGIGERLGKTNFQKKEMKNWFE